MVRLPSRIIFKLMMSVIVAPAVLAVVVMLPPRVMRLPARVKALVLFTAPELVNRMPAKDGSVAARSLLVLFWISPAKVSATPVAGVPSAFQLLPAFQRPLPAPPSHVLPANAEGVASASEMLLPSRNERKAKVGFMSGEVGRWVWWMARERGFISRKSGAIVRNPPCFVTPAK